MRVIVYQQNDLYVYKTHGISQLEEFSFRLLWTRDGGYYIIYGLMKLWNFSEDFNIFMSEHSEWVKYFLTWERNNLQAAM